MERRQDDVRADGGEDELEEGAWELDPNDPSHPDYDLSDSAGYADWDPMPRPLFMRRGVILLVAVIIIIGLMLPVFLTVF